jgi:type II secretory pathway component PulK
MRRAATREKWHSRRRQRGVVLVQALILIAGLMALMAVLVANQRVTMSATQNTLRQRRAEVAARSGLAVALATLQDANANLVTLDDDWATVGDSGNDAYELDESGSVRYRVQILDAGSRVNVNVATQTQLQALPLTMEQSDSLLDWREATAQPRPEGAKDEYYNELPEAYNAKLGRLTTLSELLLIRGWTAWDLYNPPSDNVMTTATPLEDANGNLLSLADVLTTDSGMPNTRADGTARTNISQGTLNPAALQQMGIDQGLATQIVAAAPFTTWGQLFALPGMTSLAMQRLLDDVTVVGTNRLEGKINVNTAPLGVLETVLGVSQDVASAIQTRQTSGGFQSLGELATVPGVTAQTMAQIADYIGIGSDTWIVRAYGESGGVGVAIEAVVGRRNDRMQIVTFEKLSNTTIPMWWNWEAEPLSTVPVGTPPTGSSGGAMNSGGSGGSNP